MLIKQISDFISKEALAVIATVHADGSGSESALIAFSNDEELNLVFGTSNETRKYRNIQSNNRVAFVIGWNPAMGSLQYEGVATEVPESDKEKYAALLTNRNPGAKKFAESPSQRYFVVKPTWARLTDNAGSPPGVHEITF